MAISLVWQGFPKSNIVKVKKLENSATSKLRQQSCLKELLEA